VSKKLVPTRAFENGAYIAYANHSGHENNMAYYGGSCIVAPNGNDLARTNSEYQIIRARVTKDKVVGAQKRLPYPTERLKLAWVRDDEP
jgi:predicted amidohydrolase